MGRQRDYSSDSVEECIRLCEKDLRNLGYLYSSLENIVSWTFGNGNTHSIKINSSNFKNIGHISLSYKVINSQNGSAKDFNYSIQLLTTPCNYGGVRYWLICPFVKNGSQCQRKVSNLYKPSGQGYFGCRKCHRLLYDSQRSSPSWKYFEYKFKAEKLYEKITKLTYKGKYTKKYMRYLQLNNKSFVWGIDLVNTLQARKI